MSTYNEIISQFNPWWGGIQLNLGVKREKYLSDLKKTQDSKRIKFLLGPRRAGKTVILYQFIQELIEQGENPKDILFLSLDNVSIKGLDLYSYLASSEFAYIFLDEVHKFPDWEAILKSLYDLPGRNWQIYCSGSSIKEIQDKQARLTGRNSLLKVHTLDFSEFNNFYSGEDDQVDEYMRLGGYPEFVVERYPDYLPTLLTDIVNKDIVAKHKVRNPQAVVDLLRLVSKRIGFATSNAKLANVLSISDDSVKNYLGYLEDTGLISGIEKYSPSLNDQIYTPNKLYVHDNGMRNSLTGFEDMGSLAEQTVYNSLRMSVQEEEIFYGYSANKGEVDFVLKNQDDSAELIEVKFTDNLEKIKETLSSLFLEEIFGLEITKRVVVTKSISDTISLEGKEVELVALGEFLEARAS